MTPLPAVLALWDLWVYIYFLNSSNETSNIETPVD